MTILLIEYPVKNYDAWKKLFDSDPAGREKAGVKRFRVLRPAENRNLAMVELEFDQLSQAQTLLTNLKPVWERAQKDGLIENPKARIIEVVETRELVHA